MPHDSMFTIRCEQPGAVAIETGYMRAREACRMALGVRRMPPPPWAGAWLKMTLRDERGLTVRQWDYICGKWTATLPWRPYAP